MAEANHDPGAGSEVAQDAAQMENFEQQFYDCGYEYLDHPADVQLHAWGKDLKSAFEQCAVALYGVMTDLDTIDPIQQETVDASGHDLESLLYNFLDECLFIFSAEPFLCSCMVRINELDVENFSVKATLSGEPFDLDKHPQGTEVKAITYSNLQIHQNADHCECYVIVDI